MKNLSAREVALSAVAALALLGLVVLSIVQARYELLAIGVIGGAGIGLAVAIRRALVAQAARLGRIDAEVKRIAALSEGIRRLEDLFVSPPQMLVGSQERQIAETAARFDWLARRQGEQAEHLDAFLAALEATLARQHEDLLARLDPQNTASVPAVNQVSANQGTVGPAS